MPDVDPRARAERRRAEKRLETGYGWPSPRRQRRRVRLIGLLLVVAAVILALVGPIPLPTLEDYPAWWLPLVCMVSGTLFVVASELER